MRWSFSAAARDADRADDRAERDRRGALDVVVEREQVVAVPLEDRAGVRAREVLPLEADVGKLLLDRLHEAGR